MLQLLYNLVAEAVEGRIHPPWHYILALRAVGYIFALNWTVKILFLILMLLQIHPTPCAAHFLCSSSPLHPRSLNLQQFIARFFHLLFPSGCKSKKGKITACRFYCQNTILLQINRRKWCKACQLKGEFDVCSEMNTLRDVKYWAWSQIVDNGWRNMIFNRNLSCARDFLLVLFLINNLYSHLIVEN